MTPMDATLLFLTAFAAFALWYGYKLTARRTNSDLFRQVGMALCLAGRELFCVRLSLVETNSTLTCNGVANAEKRQEAKI